MSREMEAAHFVRSAKKCADKWRAIKKKVTQDQLPERGAVAEGEEPPKKKKQTGSESEEETEEDEDGKGFKASSPSSTTTTSSTTVPTSAITPAAALTAAVAAISPSSSSTQTPARQAGRKGGRQSITYKVLEILTDEGPTAEAVPGAANGRIDFTVIAKKFEESKAAKKERKEEEKRSQGDIDKQLLDVSRATQASLDKFINLFGLLVQSRLQIPPPPPPQ